jgi:hypothetical protein
LNIDISCPLEEILEPELAWDLCYFGVVWGAPDKSVLDGRLRNSDRLRDVLIVVQQGEMLRG